MSIRPRNQIRGLLLVGVSDALGNTAMNLITATRTVIKAAAIVIFGCGVGWSMAEFETQQLALEMAPTVSGQSNAATQFMRGSLSPIRFGEATRRGVRSSVYHPTGLVRRRAASRGAAATSPSADRASATLIGLDPK